VTSAPRGFLAARGFLFEEQLRRLRRSVRMEINELRLRAKLRRMQAEMVLDPRARKALVEEAEGLEALAEERENASGALQSPSTDQAEPSPATTSL
jgi:hypothetical protein